MLRPLIQLYLVGSLTHRGTQVNNGTVGSNAIRPQFDLNLVGLQIHVSPADVMKHFHPLHNSCSSQQGETRASTVRAWRVKTALGGGGAGVAQGVGAQV